MESSNKISTDITHDLPVAIYTCDKNGYVTTYNKAAEMLWGRSPEIGKERWCGSFKIFKLDGNWLPLNEYPVVITLKGGCTGYSQEMIIERPDGSRAHVRPYAAALLDSDGTISGAVTMIKDVTEKVKNEGHLKQLAAIVEYSEDAIVSKSMNGTIQSWNNGAEKIFGYTPEEVIGKNISLIIPFELRHEEKNILEKIGNNETIQHFETIRVKKNGERVYVSLTISPLKNNDGKIIGVSKILRDITKDKFASRYARSLIEASKDPLATINSEGKIMDMNQAMMDDTDKTREQLTGCDFSIYFTDSENERKVYQEIFEKGFVIDYPLTMKNGKLTDVLINGSVYKDDEGNVLGAVVVARDIAEQKRITAELREANVSAESAVKSKQQFLSNMSHEIRTPMNAIVGFTNVMLRTRLDEKQKEYIQAIKTSGNTLIALIDDILDLAKVDAGKMIFQKTPFRLSGSVSSMLHLFETTIQEKNIELVQHYDASIPEVLLGDSVRLNQIILNLVSNAIKFTAKGRITVSVRLLNQDNKNIQVEFVVADTGIGIPNDKLEDIFGAFQQASKLTSNIFGGTGLGLAIVKQLVEGQNGTIGVISKVGEGSTFRFVLSFEKTEEKLDTESKTENKPALKNTKTLVVEDMKLNQLLMKTLLEDLGMEMDIADNGKIAIEMLKMNNYDIVLMDLQMPEMDGFEATEYIRKVMNSHVPIIALTADVTTMDVEKCKAVGMNDYISKPIDEKLFYSKIVKYLKNPEPDVVRQ